MFTLFDLLKLLCIFFFGMNGAANGAHFGIPMAIIGGLIGIAIGWAIGGLPYAFARFLLVRKNDKTTTEKLRENFFDPVGFYTGFDTLAELMKRGENLEKETGFVIDKLTSDTQIHRKVAWDCLRLIKPELAEKLQGYQPNQPPDECREIVAKVINAGDFDGNQDKNSPECPPLSRVNRLQDS